MKKTVGRFTLIDCTAIARSVGDTEPQDAVLVVDTSLDYKNDAVIFDAYAEFFDSEEELYDSDSWSTEWQDLESVSIKKED